MKKMWKKVGLLIGAIGILQFIALTVFAMFLYPDGYSFMGDFFSTLGRTVTYGGAPNMPCRTLFVIACVGAGATIVPFWLILPDFFIKSKKTKQLSLVGSACGVAASPFLMLLALFTTDTQYDPHIVSSILFFLLFGIAVLIYSVAIFLNEDYPNAFGLYGIALTITIVLYATAFFNTPLNPPIQKVIVYAIIFWAFLQISYLWNRVD